MNSSHPCSRQSGIGHVSIFWAIIPMVLFIGAAFYGYSKHVDADIAYEKAEKAISEHDALRNKFSERERQLKAITQIVGNAGEFETIIPGLTSTKAFTNPKNLEAKLTSFGNQLGIPAAIKDLDTSLNLATTKVKELSDLVAKEKSEIASLRTDLETANQTLAQVRQAKDEEIAKSLNEKQQTERNLDETRTNLGGQLADQRTKVDQARKEKRKIAEAAAKKESQWKRELQGMSARVQAMADRIKLINSPSEPDGMVLESSEMTHLAWIDRGAKDLIKRGMIFNIVEPTKKGYKTKGRVIVVRVEKDKSMVKVTSLVDPMDPIVRNDLITNEIYSPGLKRHIYLLGRFGAPFTKGEIKKILEANGNVVFDKMTPEVDLVIVGRKPLGEDATELTATPEFQAAQNWNVEIANFNKIRGFLKL